jgi:hypothetical protein
MLPLPGNIASPLDFAMPALYCSSLVNMIVSTPARQAQELDTLSDAFSHPKSFQCKCSLNVDVGAIETSEMYYSEVICDAWWLSNGIS